VARELAKHVQGSDLIPSNPPKKSDLGDKESGGFLIFITPDLSGEHMTHW
jgi:hypothetical protein